MLEQLMSILKRGGAASIDQLAVELNTTPQMVTQLVEYLEQAGRLKKIGAGCKQPCSGCYLARECHLIAHGRIWQIAD
jgi:DNA-binding Lrp family transcriptional regulator